MEPDGTGALRLATLNLDQASLNSAGAGLGDFSGTVQVLIGSPDNADNTTGTQATANATLNQGRVVEFEITNSGSGYLKPPSVSILVPKNPGGSAGQGGQQAGAIVNIETAAGADKGKVISVTPGSTIGSNDFLFGGSGYEAAPVVNMVGGGTALAAVRAVVNEYGEVGSLAAVQFGLGYDKNAPPTVTISGGGGSGARATAVVNNLGQLSPYNINLALGDQAPVFSTTPTIEIIYSDGKGTGAVARPILQGISGQAMSLVGVMPVVSGSGYTPGSVVTVKISGGTQNSIPDSLVTAVVNNDGGLGSFVISDYGSGYVSEPTVTLSGGGIQVAQVRPFVDLSPLSGNFGRITAYQVADTGSGYKSAPSLIVGVGGANGQVGEVGVSTDVVDRNIGSGTITIYNSQRGESIGNIIDDTQFRSILLNAPVATGGAKGSDGGAAYTGSVLLAGSGDIIANLNSTLYTFNSYLPSAYRGLVSTGDAFLPEGDLSGDQVLSGSITLFGLSISSALSSPLTTANISQGVPVQIGTAAGGYNGGLRATTYGTRPKGGEEGALRIYAPAPSQMEELIGQPLNPNLAVAPVPRVSNDLKLLELNTADNLLNQVRVEVGAVEGLLSLESFEPSGATASLTDGSVTSILAGETGNVYLTDPTVILDGSTVSGGTATSLVGGGTVIKIVAGLSGEGYSSAPKIDLTSVDGNGTGATATATIQDGKIVGYTITNGGYGYTTAPLVTVAAPSGTQATATLGSKTANSGIASILATTVGQGYLQAPKVTISDATGSGATAEAVLNTKGQITPYTVINGGNGYGNTAPTVTISAPDQGGVQATANAVLLNGQVIGIVPVEGGSGYSKPPTITISAPTQGTRATATAIIPEGSGGSLVAFIVTAAGSDYSNPTFSLSPPAILATANAVLVNGQITSYTITNAGGGYATAPDVTLKTSSDPFNLDIDHVGLFSDRAKFFRDGTGSERVTAAVVGIGPFTNLRPVDIGTETPGAYSIVQSDLIKFVADALVVGTRKYLDPAYGAGVITVSQAVSGDIYSLGALTLAGTREVLDLGGTTGVSFTDFAIDAGGRVSFTGAGNKIHYFSGVIRDTGLSPGASFEINSLLRTKDGTGVLPFTVGQVVVGAPEFSGKTFYQGITTQDGNIIVRADDIELTQVVGFLDTTGGGSISVSTSSVTLSPLATGGTRPVNINYNGPSKLDGTAASSSYFGFTAAQVETFGSGYTSVPTVTITGGGGTGATGTAQMVLGEINTAGGIGSGYTSVPTVTISAPTIAGGITATGEAVVDFLPSSPTYGKVIGVRITNQGSGYATGPTVTFSGGGGTTTTTSSALTVKSILLTGGSGYITAPTVTIASPTTAGGVTATATGLLGCLSLRINNPAQPELENIRATSVVIGASSGGSTLLPSAGNITLNTDFGYNYGLYPYAPRTLVLSSDKGVALGLSQIPPSPWPNPATSSIKMPNFSVIAGGAVNLGQYGLASANTQIANGSVSQMTVDYAGQGYTQAPNVTVSAPDQVGGVQALATANFDSATGQVTGFTITQAGSGYSYAPSVSLTGPIQTATTQAIMGLGNVAVTNGGTGYTSAPTVTITGGGGTGAQVAAVVRNGQVVSVTIVNPGTGYTGPATISFDGGGGTGAVANSKLQIVSLSTAGSSYYAGTGYSQSPIITITGGGGAGAEATAILNTSLGTVTGFNLLSGGSFFTSVPNVSISGTPLAPTHNFDYLSAYLSAADGVAHSFSYSKPTGSLTVADLSSLGGATGITTLSGNITLSAPDLVIPVMAPKLNDSLNTNPYITNGDGELVVNPNYNPAYTIPSTLNSSGNIYLSSTVTAGNISVAVVPVFDNAAWNNPPSGSVVNPVIQALSANTLVSLTADRIELGADGINTPPNSNLVTPLIAANTTSGVVTLQTYTAGRAITLGDKTTVDSNFTAAELSNIQGNILRIGNSKAGAILVDDLISLSTTRLTGAFSLIGNSTIVDSGGSTGISYAGGLRLSANGQINFTGIGNNFGTVAANSNGNNIVLSSGAFSIGTADSLTGITALGSRVTLQPNVVGTTINLGLTRPSTDWGFSDAELDLVTASTLQIGRKDALASGQITVSGPVTLSASKVPTLSLKTDAGVADGGVNTSSGLSVQSLSIDSGTGGISLTGQGNNVSNLAANVELSGDVSFTDYYNPVLYPNNLFSPPLNITSVDDIAGINTSQGTARSP